MPPTTSSVIRQLAALIGDALRAGLADYMRRFGGGTASLDDLIGCWSRSSGRDLSGWAQEWLRTELGAKRDDLSRWLRLVLQEQEVILRSALAARSTPRRWP